MPTKTDLPVKKKEDVSFEVERIIGSRKYKGKQQYLIKWVGLGSDENSWVDYDLMNCEELVKEFEERKKRKQEKQKERDNKEIKNDGKEEINPSEGSPLKDRVKSNTLKGSSSPMKEKKDKKHKIEPSTPNKKNKSKIEEKVGPQTPKSKTDRINKLSPRKKKDFKKSVEDSEAMNKDKLLSGTLSNIQKRYNLPPNRNIPNTYDCIVDKVEGIITKNQKRLAQVLFIDGTRKEINLEIAKIGLPIHLINYYESKN